MSRIRTVKPDLFGSYTLAVVSIEARYLFIGLFTEADDEGLLLDSPKRLAGAIFPHDEKVTSARVDRWLSDLEGTGCIVRYEVNGGRYISFPEWGKHQKISHPTPSKLPNPSGEVREVLRPEGEREREVERESSRLKAPLTPTSGGTDSSTAQNLSPRAAGTSPRQIAAAKAQAEAPVRARELARSFGAKRRAMGIYSTIEDAQDDFGNVYRGQPELIEAAIEGWSNVAAPEEVPA